VKARNRELLALVAPSLLLTGGFAAIFVERENVVSNVSLTYGAIFLGLCLAAHVLLRFTLPDADPYLFPLFAVLACFGLVMIYRIDEDLAREQAQWFVLGLALFAITIIALREDYRVLERYRYTIAAAGLALLVRDTRQLLLIGARRFMGVTIPPLKYLGPLLVVWGAAMLMLFVIQDIGSSLMFFGGFLAMLYVATNRLSFPVIGLALFAAGAWVLYQIRPTIENRVDAWLHPFDTALYDRVGGSYQIAQSLFAQADGGVFGQGFGQALLTIGGPNGHPITLLPAAQTDLIYAVITNELGLLGAGAVICVYLLAVERGFKIATLAGDSFSKLLATGLTAVFALQVFVIVGGVTRVIPLTGVTLPFISYGGSSILANFVLLALLLLVSDRARREYGR
jgi:cell division protein FtsW (lipid II flippase)